jgi:hypothetical protein
MRKYLSTFILIGVLLILVAGVIGIRYYKEKKQAAPVANNFYENLDIDHITKIEIIKAGKLLNLIREKDKWTESVVDQEPQEAEKESVDGLLSTIKDIKIKEEITNKADKQELFQVTTNTLEVRLFQGEEEIADFFIGKTTPDFNGNYIRKDGENSIYATTERISSYFSKGTFVKKEQ